MITSINRKPFSVVKETTIVIPVAYHYSFLRNFYEFLQPLLVISMSSTVFLIVDFVNSHPLIEGGGMT